MRIKIYTTPRCGDCRAAKRFLNGRGLAYEEIDLETHPESIEIVLKATGGKRQVPTLEIDGRFVVASPFDAGRLAEELGREAEGAEEIPR